MARLPTFINERTITVANATPVTPSDDAAKAGMRLASAIGQLGAGLYESEQRAVAKAEAKAEKDANFELSIALMDYQDELEREGVRREKEIQPGAKGYFDESVALAHSTADKYLRRFSGRPDAEQVQERFRKQASKFLDRANQLEVNERYRYVGEQTSRHVENYSAAIAADPANYDRVVGEFNEFVTTSVNASPRVIEGVRDLGLKKLQRAQLESLAARDPDRFRALYGSGFKPGGETMPPEIERVILNAKAANVDPRVMLGIAQYESKLDPNHPGPIRPDGTRMSSAVGMFQVIASRDTLAAIGISEDERFDVDKVSAGLSRYIARNNERMQSSNIPPTPGRQYMMWNLGEGLAWNMLRANPNETVDDVIWRTYGNRTTKSGEPFGAVVLRNNPSLYRSGMTVGQVLQNYEAKMDGAMRQVDKFANREAVTTDEQAQQLFAAFMPTGYDKLTARDAAEVAALADVGAKKRTEEAALQTRAVAIANGQIAADPGNADDAKALTHLLSQNPNLARSMLQDDAAHAQARQLVERFKVIPPEFVNVYEAAILNGTPEEKVRSFTAVADIYSRRRDIVENSKLPEEMKSRLKDYLAFTEADGLALSPQKAVERITFARSEEGKRRGQVMADVLKQELKEFDTKAVLNMFDEPWTWSSPRPVEDAAAETAQAMYADTYRLYRQQGRTIEDAKSLAFKDVKDIFGVSRVAGSAEQNFMMYPPEKYLPSFGGTHDWIKEQAYARLATHLLQRGMIEEAPASDTVTARSALSQARDFEMRLVPRAETARDIASGKSPRYELWYRRKDGQLDVIDDRYFRPDVRAAELLELERFAEENQSARRTRERTMPQPGSTVSVRGTGQELLNSAR